MAKPKVTKQQVLYREFASYSSIFQNRPVLYRVVETLVFITAVFLLTVYMSPDSGVYKVLLFGSLFVFLGGAPLLYKFLLSPTYTLTRDELIVKLGKKERQYNLTDVESLSQWKPIFNLNGKKENLMVSKDFAQRLDDQLAKVRKGRKR
ncbi:hypothetical protein BEP19_10115 [Ammoniphilus oxalaticus]|uniref:YcxB-like protein domain-containing protein n=1 Tax=Ammoniphilus oxalaticus TaxID=66863 RepID=A0A419SFP9_9BACL|nr:hypothetical protein [Ammoniphilus oxalaticus]RKD22606.1 hypothetical protein BEP19_10115 [Ammoniphilus oxalaticus]